MKNRSIIPILLLSLVGASALAAEVSPVWTDWYRHGLLVGGIQLIKMRDWLDRNALADTYVTPPVLKDCDPATEGARSPDGSCTSLNQPSMGASGMRFGRNIQISEIKVPTDAEIMDPNPREISRELLTRTDFKPVSFLNMFAATWIQFMVHDWISHGENADPKVAAPFIMQLKPGDPFGKEMIVLRTRPDPSRTSADASIPLTFQNENSSWWDGSQIYGNDLASQNKLRSFKDGKLILDPKTHRLPIDPADQVEIAGFKRNWWLGVDLMHQMFVAEHNSICDRLKASYPVDKFPEWTDQKLFDVARLINVAVMAKIHTVEWTPAILNNPILKKGMEANWFGFNSGGGHMKDFFKFVKDPVLDGIVGGKNEIHGVPYSLTEEFTSVYRLHSLLPEALDIRANEDNHAIELIPTETTRDRDAHAILDRLSKTNPSYMTDLMYSMGTQHPGQLALNNYPKFMQNMDIPVVQKMDLGTTDIIRDRERGVPRYNQFRRLLNLNPIHTFEDLTDDPIELEKLHRLYGDVEKLDLLVGTLAEAHRPDGFGFGETQFQIFLLMASRRLQADRFFTTSFRPDVYTPEGIEWVAKSNFKTVLLRHYPGLSKHLEGVDNAFKPWTN